MNSWIVTKIHQHGGQVLIESCIAMSAVLIFFGSFIYWMLYWGIQLSAELTLHEALLCKASVNNESCHKFAEKRFTDLKPLISQPKIIFRQNRTNIEAHLTAKNIFGAQYEITQIYAQK